jgi:hypothetical protein
VTARWFGWLRASTPTSFGAPPVNMKAPKVAAVFDDPSASAAAHRRDGELHKVATVLTIADQNSL